MHEIFRPRGSLVTLMSESADERTTVALCRDETSSVVWINITSVGDEPRLYCVSGGMKTVPAGEHFVAAGVIDPPGPSAGSSCSCSATAATQHGYAPRVGC